MDKALATNIEILARSFAAEVQSFWQEVKAFNAIARNIEREVQHFIGDWAFADRTLI